MASVGYSALKAYSMRLYAAMEDGSQSDIAGSIGVMDIDVYVGLAYADSSVRLFWLKKDETVGNSDIKEVDADGYVHVSIPDYSVGDALYNFDTAVTNPVKQIGRASYRERV